MVNLKEILISKLNEFNIIQHGSFTLRSGNESNIYFNFKNLVSHPSIYPILISLFKKHINNDSNNHIICGVPMGAISIATVLSQSENIPMIMVRNTKKDYGMHHQIEGEYHINMPVILIEDVITTGKSVCDTIAILENHGLTVEKIICILERDEIKVPELAKYNVESLLKMTDLAKHNIYKPYQNEYSNYLYTIANKKKSNIVLSCDLQYKNDIIKLIEKVGDKIIGVKLHSDIIIDFDDEFINDLIRLKNKYELTLIEDRKFSDIASTIIMQLEGNTYISLWADIITMHSISGGNVLDSIQKKFPDLGVILIAEMSSEGNLINCDYTNATVNIARQNNPVISGLVCQKNTFKYINKYEFLTFSPGISLHDSHDKYNQKYTNVNHIKEPIGNIWIVGRAIYNTDDVVDKTESFRKIGWKYFVDF